MLSRLAPAIRFRPAAAAALPSSRSFTALTTLNSSTRTPALADIPPNGAASFDKKQAAFRQHLKEQAQKREREESRSPVGDDVSASVPNKQSGSPSSSSSSSSIEKTTGSLASNLTGEAKAREESQEGGKSEGKLSRLIYGTAEGRNLDREMERSFSQVLARGKYVHSIVFHEVKPGKVDEYVKLVGEWYPKMASLPENKVHLVGSWRTEVGDCDTFGQLRALSHFFRFRAVGDSRKLIARLKQSTSGSTKATRAITPRFTTSNPTPASPSSIPSLRSSSTQSARR